MRGLLFRLQARSRAGHIDISLRGRARVLWGSPTLLCYTSHTETALHRLDWFSVNKQKQRHDNKGSSSGEYSGIPVWKGAHLVELVCLCGWFCPRVPEQYFLASLIGYCKSNSTSLASRREMIIRRSLIRFLMPPIVHTLPTHKPPNNCANGKYLITDKLPCLSAAPRLFCVSLLVWSKELQECEQRGKPTMLLEPPKSCTQATCIVPVVPYAQNKLPLKKRLREIRDFNWHSHFTRPSQALLRGEKKKDCLKRRGINFT